MVKKKLQLISCFAAALMVTSNLTIIKAKAAEQNPDQPNMSKQAQMYNSDLVKASAKKAYLNDMKSREVKQPIQDDNGSVNEGKLDPEKTVRLIVETSGKSLSDSTMDNKQISKAAANESLKNGVLKTQEPLKLSIKKINADVKFINNFYVFSNSFSLEAKAKDIEKIRELDGVKRVTIANEYAPEMKSAVGITKASTVWTSKGIKGEGEVVAIIDTGIDVNHKDMKITDTSKEKIHEGDINTTYTTGKGKFYTDKVPYGYNFADQNAEVKDITGSMHGMHVAGIVAANASDADVQANAGIKGTAPEAQLLAMKVFSNNPNFESAFSDNIAAAIEDSVAHGADVINMSLGSSAGYVDPQDIEQIAIQKAADSGVVCVVSAGNSQYSTAPYKLPWTQDTGIVGSPATATESLMVASYENDKVAGMVLDFKSDKENGSFYYGFNEQEPNPVTTLNSSTGYSIVDCGLGKVADFAGKNLTGKIALVSRGDINFVEKKQNAQAVGAEAIIIYNNRAGLIGGMASDKSIKIPGLSLTQEEGNKLKSLNGSNLKLTFKDKQTVIDNANAKIMSDFTSWGPTPNLSLRPYISAPGGMINSTVNNNKYETMSGTSMASPHTAGLTALVLEYMSRSDEFKALIDKDKVEAAKSLLVNTAIPSIDALTKTSKLPYSPRRQGAGLANIDAAMKSPVIATFTENNEAVASLKDIKDAKTPRVFNVKLKNYGKTDVTYNVSDAFGVMTEQPKLIKTMSFDVLAADASISIDNNKVTVLAGKEVQVACTLNVSATTPKNAFLEGFLKFEPDNKDLATLGMPYLAFNGDWSEPSIFEEPVWSENVLWGKTMLSTLSEGKIYPLGVDGVDVNGDTIFNPAHIAINPDAQDGNNVLPVLSLLRNAKNLSVEVVDEKGNTVRKIANSENLRKSFTGHTFSEINAWKFDGTTYNSSIGSYLSLPEGQYGIKVSANVDYENAKTQTLTMPVKIDKTPSQITDLTYSEVRTGVYNIKFKAIDNLSDVAGFALMVDTPDNMYKFNNSVIARMAPDKDGYYNMMVNLGEENHLLNLIAFDNAGNMGIDPFIISNVQITEPAPGKKLYSGDLDIKFEVNPKTIDSITGYEVYMSKDGGNNFDKIANLDKFATTYRVRRLDPGKYYFAIKALTNNAKENTGYMSMTYVVVNATKMNLVVTSPQPGASYTPNDTIKIDGTIDVVPNKFIIGGVKITPVKATVDVLDADGKPTGLKKDTFTFSVVLDKTKLVRGDNKVPVYAELQDAFGNIVDKEEYAIDVYYEDKMPELTISNTLTQLGANFYDYIDAKDATYIVKGTASAYLEGYDLFINGEPKLSVATNSTIKDDTNVTKKTFEVPVTLVDKDPKIEVKLVSKSGLTVRKIINVRRMDYPSYGLCLNSNLVDGITVTNEIFTVGVKVNPRMANMTLKVNDKEVTLSKTTDIYGTNVALVPGANTIKIEANCDGNKDPLVKTFTVNYTAVQKSTPTFAYSIGDKQADGTLLVSLPRTQNTLTLKGTASDKLYGFKVALALKNANGGLLGAEENMIIGQKSEAGDLAVEKVIQVTPDLDSCTIIVTNTQGSKVVKTVKIATTDEFVSNFGVMFNKPLYNGMMVNSSFIRFEGNVTDELTTFKINGMDVVIDKSKGFNIVTSLNEGQNQVTIEMALKSAQDKALKKTFNVISDTIAPVINVNSTPDTVNVTSDTNKLTLSGTVLEVNSPVLYVNDSLVALNEKNEFTTDVQLVEGVNKIHLVSLDAVSNTSEKYITVNRVSNKVASLAGIKVNGVVLSNFNPLVFDYKYIVGAREKNIPVVEGLKSDGSKVTVEISDAKQIPGTTTVEVTSEDGLTKSTYTISFIKTIDVSLRCIRNNGAGSDVVYSATLTNNQSTVQKASLILAVSDEFGRLISYNAGTQNVEAGKTVELTAKIKAPEFQKYTINAMVWDSLESMNPLTDIINSQSIVDTNLIDVTNSFAQQFLGMNVVSISTLKNVDSVTVNDVVAQKNVDGKWIINNLSNVKIGESITVVAKMITGETQCITLKLIESLIKPTL